MLVGHGRPDVLEGEVFIYALQHLCFLLLCKSYLFFLLDIEKLSELWVEAAEPVERSSFNNFRQWIAVLVGLKKGL